MEEHQQQLLQCLRSALFRQEAVQWPEDEGERSALLALAEEQHVLPLVLDRLIPAAKAAGADGETLRPLRQLLLFRIILCFFYPCYFPSSTISICPGANQSNSFLPLYSPSILSILF